MAGERRRFCATPDGFAVMAVAMAALAALPVAALGAIAAGGGWSHWATLFATVIPDALRETGLLAAGVLVFVVGIGTAGAWIVTAYDFPGRRAIEIALLLPLAFPVYVLAFAWLDLLHPIGPLQSALRALLGYARPADLRLGDLRSLPGAILIFGLALYPYVYVAARAVFLSQMTSLGEAARMLGASPMAVLFRIALPLARPAIAAGAALALMEMLNDIGAAEFLGINTLTAAVYNTWVNRSDLPGAAQIALTMLALVLALIALERARRGNRSYAVIGRASRALSPRPVGGIAGAALATVTALPALFGFVVPALHLLRQTLLRIGDTGFSRDIIIATGNTLLIAASVTMLCLLVAMPVVAGARLYPHARWRQALNHVSAIGYAIPGTVLAIGLVVVYGGLDGLVRSAAMMLDIRTSGLFMSASVAGVVVALMLRFFRLATAKIDTGLERIAPALDHAARSLGRTPLAVMTEIHLPQLRPAFAAAALLVFVDCMKELPATLLLRPMNFETLATLLYGEAARGTYENGALAACLIVAFGLLPVVLLTRIGRRSAPARPVEVTS